MEVVIKISDEDYQLMKDGHIPFNILDKMMNGIPLPKGHGDLIDRNELKKVYDKRITYLYALNKKDNPSRGAKICAINWCANTIDELPTILEADTESEE